MRVAAWRLPTCTGGSFALKSSSSDKSSASVTSIASFKRRALKMVAPSPLLDFLALYVQRPLNKRWPPRVRECACSRDLGRSTSYRRACEALALKNLP